jgi:hypothetical protein
MKKIILTMSILMLFAAASYAQIQKGSVLVGASSNLGFSSISYDDGDDNFKVFILDLKAGYFVIDNLAVGLNFGYSKYSFGDTDASTTLFGLFGRYYVNGKIFVGAGYSSSKLEDSDASNSLPLEAGYEAFITDNIALEPSVSYSIGLGDNESNTFGLNLGFALYFNR